MKTYACIEWNSYWRAWVARVESQDYRDGSNIYGEAYVIPGWPGGCAHREDVVALCLKLGYELVDTTTHYMHQYNPDTKRTVFTHIEQWPARLPA
jgi:hypothetical protein